MAGGVNWDTASAIAIPVGYEVELHASSHWRDSDLIETMHGRWELDDGLERMACQQLSSDMNNNLE